MHPSHVFLIKNLTTCPSVLPTRRRSYRGRGLFYNINGFNADVLYEEGSQLIAYVRHPLPPISAQITSIIAHYHVLILLMALIHLLSWLRQHFHLI
jgi:hypothetical protein